MYKNPIVSIVMNALNTIIAEFVETLALPLSHGRKILEGHRDILDRMKTQDLSWAWEKIDVHILYFTDEFKRLAPMKSIDFDQLFEEV